MDSREKGFNLDLESEGSASEEDVSLQFASSKGPTKKFLGSALGGVLSSHESIMRTSGIESSSCSEKSNELVNDSVRLLVQSNSAEEESQGNTTLDSDRRRKTNSRNAPKPPRPPKGPSLDAADQKLVKEISERVRSKRARIKQLKAAKKLKESNSSSLHSGISAMIITLLFFFVVIFQGISSRSVPNMSIQGSPQPAVATTLGLFSAEYYKSSIPSSAYKSLTEDQVSGSGTGARMRKLMVNMKDS